MACARCTTLPTLPEEPGTLVLTAPAQELIDKLSAFLDAQALNHQREPFGLLIPDTNLVELLTRVKDSRSFNTHESRDISVMPLKSDQPLSLAHFAGAKTLERWLGLLGSRPLLEILEARRFVSWFQPVLCAHTGTVVGYESLLRGQRADGTLALPDFRGSSDSFENKRLVAI